METLRIVIPSRRRSQNIGHMLGLLPGATVCVAREEADAYRAVVPKKQLLLHDNLPGLVHIRNWLNESIQEDCLVQVDDDLRWVAALIGKSRKIVNPAVIAQIIANSHYIAADLDIGCFCWSRTQNTVLLRPEFWPVRFVGPVSCSFGLRGAARSRQFDIKFEGRADFDFTLQTLLDDRILYCDTRFYFDHGRIFGGRGGNVGLIDSAKFDESGRLLAEKWGRFINRKAPGFVKKKNVSTMGVRVSRKNPVAER